jgi:hypothetical protein
MRPWPLRWLRRRTPKDSTGGNRAQPLREGKREVLGVIGVPIGVNDLASLRTATGVPPSPRSNRPAPANRTTQSYRINWGRARRNTGFLSDAYVMPNCCLLFFMKRMVRRCQMSILKRLLKILKQAGNDLEAPVPRSFHVSAGARRHPEFHEAPGAFRRPPGRLKLCCYSMPFAA